MKQDRAYPRITVTKKAEASLTGGHPWVYAEEILKVEVPGDQAAGADLIHSESSADTSSLPNGSLVDIISTKGRYLGTGMLSEHSKIRARLISRNANDRFDEPFWERRLRYAIDYRKTVMPGDDFNACRLIFGEADMLPGLTVDLFNDILVTQTLSIGIEQRKDLLFTTLIRLMDEAGHPVRGLFERNDVTLRDREGLEQNKGWYYLKEGASDSPLTEIVENGIRYNVDVENGQKTGFFLDQKYNRREIARIAGGHTVLDCFTHTGSFALNAARGGAKHVTAVDISESAIEMAKQNAQLNGFYNSVLDTGSYAAAPSAASGNVMDFLVEDIFELLPRLEAGKSPYDFIILDPPAFTKSRKTLDSALRGYKEINMRAMRLLPRGGYLATCSCSHFADDWHFRKMLESAAKDAAVSLRQIEARQQSPDHPILWGVPETDYLKFYIFQVV